MCAILSLRCTSVFTQTYVSSQAVWRSTKEYLSKITHNKYLQYIDRKFGHTRFGFWRKLKWFKKGIMLTVFLCYDLLLTYQPLKNKFTHIRLSKTLCIISSSSYHCESICPGNYCLPYLYLSSSDNMSITN